MNLHTAENFWPLKNGLLEDFSSLKRNIRTDVLVMGAGISGALVADALCEQGFEVVMVDKRHCATGSTAASTALLQYEIDKPLVDLAKLVGEDNAVRSYHLCLQSIQDLKKISKTAKVDAHFESKKSFQYASSPSHVAKLEKEWRFREKHKISKIDWLESAEIEKKFGFSKSAGILSKDGAEVDPFKLTYGLIQKHLKKSLQVYVNTEVMEIVHHRNSVTVTTDAGYLIQAKKLVIACGYESQKYLTKKVEIQRSTYAILSEVLEEKNHWYQNCLIWETANPYLYLRTTADNRILIGGKDDDFYNPKKRDESLPRKTRALEDSFGELFPKINFRTDYHWAGTFCGTKDGLPYIGAIPERANTYFALGFGGNGITFSVIASQIVSDLIRGKKNEDAALFSFDR